MKSFVINLDRDTHRLSLFRERFAEVPEIQVTRVAGVYGKDLPRAARLRLSGSEFWSSRRGEIGCFLSHVRVWEMISSEEGPCLVLEDDAVPNYLTRLFDLRIPADADLIFVNSRMCPGDKVSDPIKLLPILEAINLLNKTGEGVGTDGYILTPNGARKMLLAIQSDGFFGHVDWRMLRYSVKPDDLGPDLAGTRCDVVIRTHHNPAMMPKWGVVKAYCLNSPLIKLPIQNNSTIVEANK